MRRAGMSIALTAIANRLAMEVFIVAEIYCIIKRGATTNQVKSQMAGEIAVWRDKRLTE